MATFSDVLSVAAFLSLLIVVLIVLNADRPRPR